MITIHLTILTLTVLLIIFTDSMGLLWMLGKKQALPEKLFKTLHKLVWLGLLGMIGTGIYMATSYGGYLATQPLFGLKMFFVLLLVINAFLIGRHMELAFKTSFLEIPHAEKRALLISGLVSTTAWIGAFVAAKMLF